MMFALQFFSVTAKADPWKVKLIEISPSRQVYLFQTDSSLPEESTILVIKKDDIAICASQVLRVIPGKHAFAVNLFTSDSVTSMLQVGEKYLAVVPKVYYLPSPVTPTEVKEAEMMEERAGGGAAAGSIYESRPSFELGPRLFTHYNQAVLITTAPGTFQGELEFNYWFGRALAVYGLAALGVAGASSSDFGLGLKFAFLRFSGGDGWFGNLSVQLILDGVLYSTVAPTPQEVYESNGLIVRYGVGMNWELGQSRYFLDTTFLIAQLSGNLFIAPFLGLGRHF